MYWYGQSTMCLDHFVWEHINVSWAAQVNYIQIPISRFTVSFLCFFFNPPFFDGKDHHVLVKSQVQRAGFFRLTSRLWHRSRIADWKSRIVFFSKNGQSTSHICGKTSMLWVFEGSTTNFHYFFLTTAEVCSKFHFSGPIRKKKSLSDPSLPVDRDSRSRTSWVYSRYQGELTKGWRVSPCAFHLGIVTSQWPRWNHGNYPFWKALFQV